MAFEQWTQSLKGHRDLDADWRTYQSWTQSNPEEAKAGFDRVTEEEAIRFAVHPETEDQCLRIAYGLLPEDAMPLHRHLCASFVLEGLGTEPHADELGFIGSLMEPWCAEGGRYGCFLDGPSNVSLDHRIVHIELGEIPESAAEMRPVAAFLITNLVRNQIKRMPRNLRKRVVLEELGAFLTIPGGERIVREFFERMRKYQCQVIAVTQQVASLSETAVGRSILGNAKQAILLRQTNPSELAVLAEHLRLPDAAVETVMRLPDPAIAGRAGFLVARQDEGQIMITAGFHQASQEMIALASSSGAAFASRHTA